MLEIELKYRTEDFAALKAKLAAWKARRDDPILESDYYYNAPDRDFRVTGEVFRLRRIGAENFATYKGLKEPGPVKTRRELEIALQEGDEAAEEFRELLRCLGYRFVAVVKKVRTIHHFRRGDFKLQACFDDVEDVGRFVEIEIVAPEEHREAAQEVLLETADELGLADPEPRSYLTMQIGNR